MNELEALRKSQQLNQSRIDNFQDFINQLTEQLQTKIAGQQLGEIQLKASEERFRTLFEKAPFGIAIYNKYNRFWRAINLDQQALFLHQHGTIILCQ